jgi:phosphatidylinositol alpha-1,6-mannosyltransferase
MPSIIYNKSVEGFGIAFIEAGQHGVPSIGGKDGGASDAIIHNKTGLICNGNDLDSIYQSIKSIFEEDRYLKFGKNAKEFSKQFEWSKIIKKYIELLN